MFLWRWGKGTIRTRLQGEAAECGLACLTMVLDYWGFASTVQELRVRFGTSSRGMNLAQLAELAAASGLSPRPLRLELDDISSLQVPCILHWGMNHFVVLERASSRKFTIVDPAIGRRTIGLQELSAKFTGVALELTPSATFKTKPSPPRISFTQLAGNVRGLVPGLAQLVLLSLALQVFTVLGPLLIQLVLDQVVVSADTSLLTTICLAFLALLLFQAAVTALRSWCALTLSSELGFQWASNVLRHLLRLPGSYFEKRQLGDVVSRMGSVEALKEAATNVAVNILVDGLLTVTMIAAMAIYSPKLAAISLVAFGLYILLRVVTYPAFLRANEAELVLTASQGGHLLESLRGHLTIKTTGAELVRHAQWQSLAIDSLNQRLRISRMNISFSAASQIIQGADRILVIWLGAQLIIDNVFSVGMLVAYLSYKDQFSNRASTLFDALISLRMLRIHVDRLSDIVLSEPEQTEPEMAALQHGGAGVSLELRGVSFQYSSHDPLVLDGVNLSVPNGEHLAIAGPSGCGKTTLLKIMLGVLKPTSGVVLVNGVPLEKFGIRRFRSLCGAVLQEDQLFSGSIAENIAFGADEVDLARAQAVARAAAIHDEIVSMPMGYNTLVGDMGIVFSSGQKQRLILARALYREPKAIFLDEATSHLDGQNELSVSNSIRSLGITTIVVAHLTETLNAADRVVSLDQLNDPSRGGLERSSAV